MDWYPSISNLFLLHVGMHTYSKAKAIGTFPDTINNLIWVGDIDTNYIPIETSQNSTIMYQDPDVPTIPFSKARIFTANYTYKFSLSPGRKCAKYAYLIREFSINVTSSILNLTFAPSTENPNAFAFINGIEIVSSPDLFSISPAYYGDGTHTKFPYDPGMAFQTMYRLNVGGRSLAPFEDSSSLYRTWDDDSDYIFGAAVGVTIQNDTNVIIEYPPIVPQYVAPVSVYETARSMGPNPQINLNYNLTWILTVRRCRVLLPPEIPFLRDTIPDNPGQPIDGGGIGKPVYMDYVVATVGLGQIDMWVAFHPDLSTGSAYFDAILNGLEVFKMGMTDNTFAGLNPVPVAQNTIDPTRTNGKKHDSSKKKIVKIIGLVVGVPCGVLLSSLLVFSLFCATCKRLKNKKKQSKEDKVSTHSTVWTPLSLYRFSSSHSDDPSKANTTGTGIGTGTYNSPLWTNLCRHFSFPEILAATNGFDEALVLGVGRSDKVYRGEIDNGSTMVAVKRANPLSEQGFHKFQTEIEMLSQLRHRHLVSLIGYCEESNEMILVYDYMAHGTLQQHLYESQNSPLTWSQRLKNLH
ncbi:Receptor-like protein kinase FERONIA [Rhynchospora pubera]|uniref:Receptor-like protein kinase FERONIA n=1 Tax=Rhynchospora pubera TaxID=906938 RepID=A0AAV8GJK0_9POAL|nr:Receptor-like protein kinase FERONIA [Rhynchospora pubera]